MNELKIKKVANAIFLNCLILKASKADKNIPLMLFNTYVALMGRKSVRSNVDLLFIKIAGTMAKSVHDKATHTDNSLTP